MEKELDKKYKTEELDEILDEKSQKKEIHREIAIPKQEGTVIKVKKDCLIISDSNGNGLRIPLENKYKNAKKGDIIKF